ncbi:MAG: hypothetical protein MUF15_25180, partial [Acidobacteria bacterium]|nr:hypothetical protein [Acidobacteriota bacterium]
ASGEKWLLEKIDSFIRYLLENSYSGPKGVYWDRSPKNINGLCGFGNGASGIGFALLELGHYFNNDSFYWLAEQAFLYESCFYDESNKNWRDLRLVFNKYENYKTHENAYLKGDLDFFTGKGRDINNWICGAAGIGLTRLQAFDLLKNPIYKLEAQNALEKTLKSMPPTPKNEEISRMFTLAEGEAGYAELFLESAAIFNNPHYLTQAESIAVKALVYWQEHHHYPSGLRFDNKQGNSSLFMGDPGIGYLYLRVLEPQKVPSILMPKVGTPAAEHLPISPTLPYISISLPDIKKKILNRYFRRSIMLCERILPHKLEFFLSHDNRKGGNSVLKEEFHTFLEQVLPTLPPQHECMTEIAALEMDLKKMDGNISSHNLLYIKERLLQRDAEKWRNMETGALMDSFLELDKDVRLHACAFPWEPDLKKMPVEEFKNNDREPQQYFVLLKAEAMGITENTLSPFAYAILAEFNESQKVSDAIPLIIDSFGEISGDERELIIGEIISQVKEMLAAGILVRGNVIH